MEPLSRRDFLKLSLLGLSGLAFSPFNGAGEDFDSLNLARVSAKQVSVYKKPSDSSTILFQRYRDELVHIYYEEIAKDGPVYNPLWYRVWGGYIHSAHLVRVNMRLNTPLNGVSEKGQLMEVTVPYSQSLYFNKYKKEWEQVYRLYFGSNHWVIGVETGPDGKAWYRIQDDLSKDEYLVHATHLRPFQPDELMPITPEVDLGKKRIEISLAKQELTAYEDEKIVLKTKISSGMSRHTNPGEIPTETPRGTFNISSKMPSKHMGDAFLTNDPEAYVIPGVPWVSFFETETGVACHGTYWHNNFGTPMSHGCINMRNDEAKFIYLWTTPVIKPGEWHHKGYGTRVIVT
jgi:hypothetical protein